MPDFSGYLSLRSLSGHKGIVVNLVVLGAQASRDDQAAEQNSTYWSSHEIELLLSNQSTGVATVKPDTVAERRHYYAVACKASINIGWIQTTARLPVQSSRLYSRRGAKGCLLHSPWTRRVPGLRGCL